MFMLCAFIDLNVGDRVFFVIFNFQQNKTLYEWKFHDIKSAIVHAQGFQLSIKHFVAAEGCISFPDRAYWLGSLNRYT